MILSLTLLNGPGILPETTVGKHNAICRCQIKLYHAKKKPYVNIVLWSDESKFDILVGNHGCHVLRAKEKGDLPVCYQHLVQKLPALMVWGCICACGMGSLHVLEGTMNIL